MINGKAFGIFVCIILSLFGFVVFQTTKSCSNNVQTVAERLPIVAVTDAKQNGEIAKLSQQVEQLQETVSELSKKIAKVDSSRLKNRTFK